MATRDTFGHVRRALALILVACGARTPLASTAALDAGKDVESGSDAAMSPCSALASIAATGPHPDAIALDGDHVYWHDQNGIFRVPKKGGSPSLVATTVSTFWPELVPFAIASGNVYFAGAGDALSFVPVGGGTATSIGKSFAQAGFAASDSWVYAWSQAQGATPLVRFHFDGSGATQVDSMAHPPNEMVFGPNEVAYVAFDPGVQQNDYSSMAGASDTDLSGLAAEDIAVSGSQVYFTSNDSTNGARVMTVSTDTKIVSPIADTFGAVTLALDDADLYFADGDGLRVRRVAGKTGPVTDVATVGPDAAPIDLALDGTCVYFTVAPRAGADAPGAVMVAPKP